MGRTADVLRHRSYLVGPELDLYTKRTCPTDSRTVGERSKTHPEQVPQQCRPNRTAWPRSERHGTARHGTAGRLPGGSAALRRSATVSHTVSHCATRFSRSRVIMPSPSGSATPIKLSIFSCRSCIVARKGKETCETCSAKTQVGHETGRVMNAHTAAQDAGSMLRVGCLHSGGYSVEDAIADTDQVFRRTLGVRKSSCRIMLHVVPTRRCASCRRAHLLSACVCQCAALALVDGTVQRRLLLLSSAKRTCANIGLRTVRFVLSRRRCAEAAAASEQSIGNAQQS